MARSHKRFATTGYARKVAGVSQQTIIREFDGGSLKGHLIFGSRFRHIDMEHLYDRMIADGRSESDAAKADPRYRVLIIGEVGVDQEQELSERLSAVDGIRIHFAGSKSDHPTTASLLSWGPDAVVMFELSEEIARSSAQAITRTSFNDIPLIYFAPSPLRIDEQEILQAGATDVFNGRTTIEQLSNRVRELAREWIAAGEK